MACDEIKPDIRALIMLLGLHTYIIIIFQNIDKIYFFLSSLNFTILLLQIEFFHYFRTDL